MSHGFFKKKEIADIYVRHLGIDTELTTRELAERDLAERNLDIPDAAPAVFKVVQALRHAKRKKLVRMIDKKKGMCVWGAGNTVALRAAANTPSTTG